MTTNANLPAALLRARQKLAEETKAGAHTLPNDADRNGNNDTLLIPESDVQDEPTDQDRGTPATSSIKHPQSPGNFRPHEDVSQRKNYQQFTFDAPDPQRQPPPAGILTAESATITGKDKRNDDQQPIANGHDTQATQHRRWQLALTEYCKVKSIEENKYAQEQGIDRATYREWVLGDIKGLPEREPTLLYLHPPSFMSATDIEEDIQAVIDVYLPAKREDAQYETGLPAKRQSTIVVEDADSAIISNADYLSHSAIVDRLYYTHHGSLHVGGKHEGKTTSAKTEALVIASGTRTLYGREVMQSPVIYAASEDEYPSVRMDFLQMGWNPRIPLVMVKIADNADRDFILEDIAALAMKMCAYYVILDMLFDFTQIQDELKYAHTREATGKVIQLATAIKGHVKATHHSPKWMPDAASAAKAALGSQGIAARFSPIVLSKMWIEPRDDRPGLYTVESTMTRDPRGLAIPPTLVTRDEQGWAISGEPFKSWMKWPIYAHRIIDFFEMSELGKRFTVATVAKELNIPRPETQNAMFRLTLGDNPKLERMKKIMGRGGGYTYGLTGRNSLMLPTNATSDDTRT